MFTLLVFVLNKNKLSQVLMEQIQNQYSFNSAATFVYLLQWISS